MQPIPTPFVLLQSDSATFFLFKTMDIRICSGDADRISQLPEDIIRHILSLLPTTDLFRVSVLSKVWYSFFSCFPVSDFSLESSSSLDEERILQFVKFVHSSLHRQSLHYKCIPKFKLSIPFYPEYPQLFIDLIDSSVLLSRQFGVQELSLHFSDESWFKYKLSEAIFPAKEFPFPNTNWLSLRVFSLKGVDIPDEKIIENLIFTCPLMEKFSLNYCYGLMQLKLLGFKKLKKVKFENAIFRDEFPNEVQRVEIDALSLQTFSYSTSRDKTPHIDLTSCKNLEVLKFHASSITESIIQDINSKFPVLKFLALRGRARDRMIELSCPCLEELDLSQGGAKVITINAPCLEELRLSTNFTEAIVINATRLTSFHCFLGVEIPFSLSLNQSSLEEVFFEASLEHICSRDGYNFLKSLMKNIENFNEISQVTWYIEDFKWVHQMVSNISIPALLHIKHLTLRMDLDYAAHYLRDDESQALVDVLFHFCHPESLVLECGCSWGPNVECIKILCKNLLHSCCLATNGNCWQRDFKGIVQIELIKGNGDINVLSCNVLLDSLSTLAREEEIHFVFKW